MKQDKITRAWLKKQGACKEDIEYFDTLGISDVLELIKKLREDKKAHYLAWLARNIDSKEALALLAKDASAYVRYEAARSPNTSKETLALLAKDKDADVRYGVAENPNTDKKGVR